MRASWTIRACIRTRTTRQQQLPAVDAERKRAQVPHGAMVWRYRSVRGDALLMMFSRYLARMTLRRSRCRRPVGTSASFRGASVQRPPPPRRARAWLGSPIGQRASTEARRHLCFECQRDGGRGTSRVNPFRAAVRATRPRRLSSMKGGGLGPDEGLQRQSPLALYGQTDRAGGLHQAASLFSRGAKP